MAVPSIGDRLKLLAVLCGTLLVSAYPGPGIALGGSEQEASSISSQERLRGSGADQYENGEDPEPDTFPAGTGGDHPRPDPSVGGGGGAPAPQVIRNLPKTPDNGSTDGFGRGASARAIPLSYNAAAYCRTREDGHGSRPVTDATAVFPLAEAYFDSYEDSWGAARPQGGHEGTDLMSPTGTPMYAITDGTVVSVAGSNANGWNYLGGYTVMVRADYGIGPVKKGDLFYYAHMDRETPLPLGAEVEAGDQVGVVGDTGYGSEGTRGQFPPHLHLGWYDTTGTTAQAPSGAMNPYPLLEWLKRNGGTATGGWGRSGATERYCDYQERAADSPATGAHGDHGRDLPPGASSGSSADLDPGSPDPRPNPVVKRVVQRVAERTEHSRTDRPRADRNDDSRAERASLSRRNPDIRPRSPRERPGSVTPPRTAPERPARNAESSNVKRPDIERANAGRDGESRAEGTRRSRAMPDDWPRAGGGSVESPRRPPQGPLDRADPEREPEPSEVGESRVSILPVVFHDEDANGRRDPGEPPLAGWFVQTSRPGSPGVSGESGERIEGLKAGAYRVTVRVEKGYLATTPESVRFRAGERRVARVSFGVVEAAELTVSACSPDDAGGASCTGTGLGSLELELRDERGRGIPVSRITGGELGFSGLFPGSYELSAAPRSSSPAVEPRTWRLTLSAGESPSLRLPPSTGSREQRPEGRRPDTRVGTHDEAPAREPEEEGT